MWPRAAFSLPDGAVRFVTVGTLGRGVNKRVDVSIRATAIAAAAGEHIRVGFEDAVTLPDGSSATSNAQLVEHAVRLGAALGRAPMPPDEARRLLR